MGLRFVRLSDRSSKLVVKVAEALLDRSWHNYSICEKTGQYIKQIRALKSDCVATIVWLAGEVKLSPQMYGNERIADLLIDPLKRSAMAEVQSSAKADLVDLLKGQFVRTAGMSAILNAARSVTNADVITSEAVIPMISSTFCGPMSS